MKITKIDIIVLITLLISSLIIAIFVSYFAHRSITRGKAKDRSKTIYRIVFKDFLELFSSINDWERKIESRLSFYSTDKNREGNRIGYVHNGIISFYDDLFMFKNIIEHAKFLLWSRINKNRKKEITEVDYKDHKVRLELNKG